MCVFFCLFVVGFFGGVEDGKAMDYKIKYVNWKENIVSNYLDCMAHFHTKSLRQTTK